MMLSNALIYLFLVQYDATITICILDTHFRHQFTVSLTIICHKIVGIFVMCFVGFLCVEVAAY